MKSLDIGMILGRDELTLVEAKGVGSEGVVPDATSVEVLTSSVWRVGTDGRRMDDGSDSGLLYTS